METPKKKLIGFAAMTKEQRSLISSKGGRRAHELGRAHRFTTHTGKEAVLQRILRKREEVKKASETL